VLLILVVLVGLAAAEDIGYLGNCKCGRPTGISDAIIGGKDTTPEAYPWHVALVNPTQNKWSPCGASLITDRHVLTAAHCVEGQTTKQVAVALGPRTRTDVQRNAQILPVKTITIHPKWDTNRIRNDIAILELVNPVPNYGTKNIPSCLPYEDTKPSKLILTGWGVTGNPQRGGKVSETLQMAQLTPVDMSVCAKMFPGIDTKAQICAGGPNNSACSGDSGGPLVDNVNGQSIQVGVVSYGRTDCGVETRAAGAFTKVNYFFDWILDTVGPAKPVWCSGTWTG